MIELRRTITALSLASAMLMMAPAIASAKGGHSGTFGDAGGAVASAGHAGAGGDHEGRGHDGRFSGRHGDDDALAQFDDLDFQPVSTCGVYRHRWHQTGQRYWLRRYENCLHG
jgi:hypothetical protein